MYSEAKTKVSNDGKHYFFKLYGLSLRYTLPRLMPTLNARKHCIVF